MQEEDFPALHRAADQLSLNAQQHFFKVLFCHLMMLFAAAVLSVLNSPAWQAAVAQALVLMGALGCSIYLAWKRASNAFHCEFTIAAAGGGTTRLRLNIWHQDWVCVAVYPFALSHFAVRRVMLTPTVTMPSIFRMLVALMRSACVS